MNKKKPAKKPTTARRTSGKKTPRKPAAGRKQGPKQRTRGTKTAATAKGHSFAQLLPNVMGRSTTDALGVVLAVFQKGGGKAQRHVVALDRPVAASEKARRQEGAKILKEPAAAARLLHGAAHAERLRLMAELLPGARTHHDLKTATGLKAGPLYHHIRELERADLVVSPARNRYELTETGRLAFLLIAGLSAMSSKGKRTAPWRSGRTPPTNVR